MSVNVNTASFGKIKHSLSIHSIKTGYSATAVCYLLLAGIFIYPSLAPFSDTGKNLSLQGIILIAMGALALLGIALDRAVFTKIPAGFKVLIAIYLASLAVTSVFVPSSLTLLGPRWLRLGTLGLASCVMISLVMRRVRPKLLLSTLYASSVLLAVTSLMLGWLRYGYIVRLIGPFYQADALGAYLAAGFLIGLTLMAANKSRLWPLLCTQTLLAIALLLTETRAVIYLLIIFSTLLVIKLKPGKSVARSLGAVAALIIGLLILGAGLNSQLTNRLSNASYAEQSITYRLDLQLATLKIIPSLPLYGAGPGNIPQILTCHKLTAPPLRQTCSQHYRFGSSHNVFLDRYLDLGLAGPIFLVIVIAAAIILLTRIKDLGQTESTFLAVTLLIFFYYLSNVTVPSLELLLCISLFCPLPRRQLRESDICPANLASKRHILPDSPRPFGL